jgi:hypothetical protein
MKGLPKMSAGTIRISAPISTQSVVRGRGHDGGVITDPHLRDDGVRGLSKKSAMWRKAFFPRRTPVTFSPQRDDIPVCTEARLDREKTWQIPAR